MVAAVRQRSVDPPCERGFGRALTIGPWSSAIPRPGCARGAVSRALHSLTEVRHFPKIKGSWTLSAEHVDGGQKGAELRVYKRFMAGLSGVVLLGCAHTSTKVSPSVEADPTVTVDESTSASWRTVTEVDVYGDDASVATIDQVEHEQITFVEDIETLVEDTPDVEEIPPTLAREILPGVPLVYNGAVQMFMDYFKGRGRDRFEMWLGRSGAYIPLMQDILIEEGLPPDLVYLALIESGFSPHAYSHASAVGFWQFIKPTGKRYGLRIDEWIDERRDPVKATRAAARYLKDLYRMFGDWHLAAAGYNAGEGRIRRAIRTYNSQDYWKLIEYRHLARETKQYVPKLIAAILLARNPEEHGFVPQYKDPLIRAAVTVPPGTDLMMAAYAADISYSEIRRLNPELLRWATPPDIASYELKLPLDRIEGFAERLAAAPATAATPFKVVKLAKGQNPEALAWQLKVSYSDVKLLNPGLKGWAGERILLPIGEDGTRFSETRRSKTIASRGVVKVRRGDSLWSIAKRYGVTTRALAKYNKLNSNVIRPGQRLRIPPKWYMASR